MTKEALKLALEALEKCKVALAEELGAWDIEPPLHHVLKAHELCIPAITAIKEALANEALEKMAENARELGLDYEPAQPYKGIADHTNQVTNGRMRIDPVTGDVGIGTP